MKVAFAERGWNSFGMTKLMVVDGLEGDGRVL